MKNVDKQTPPDKTDSKASAEEAPAERLVASRFRFLNEQLYTQPAKEAQEVFRDDDDAFKAYHSGYRKQLEKWPLNPLDTLIEDLDSLGDGTIIVDMGRFIFGIVCGVFIY